MSKPKEELVDNIKTHFSVGAIIRNDEGDLLMIDRLKPPFGFACPAGHVDEGEEPLTAVLREVEEETGLTITSYKEASMEDLKDYPNEPCSRGITNHLWKIYEMKATGNFIFKNDEVKSIGWYSPEKIRTLELESIWRHFLVRLNII